MFISDKPIESPNEDALGNSRFAELLANAVLSVNESDSFVIGLYGSWGTGKTSVVNLALRLADERCRADKGQDAPIAFSYSPWACSAGDEIQYQFFLQFSSALSRVDGARKAAKKAAKLLAEYGEAISLASPPVGAALKPALLRLADDADIAGLRKDIEKRLGKLSRRIVVVIDDLDRLSSGQIMSVFQLVCAVANFRNTVFVLPFDYDVVTRALGEMQGTGADGAGYLSKIVQIPLEMPFPKRDRVRGELEKMLGLYMGALSEGEADMVRRAIGEVAMPHIRTMRDAKRVANAFSFARLSSDGELNRADLLALSVFQAFDPALYDFVRANRKLLCEYDYLPGDSASAFEGRLDSELVAHCGDGGLDGRKRMLALIFDKVVHPTRPLSLGGNRKFRRLSCPDYFDAYFSHSADDVLVSVSDVEALMAGPDEADEAIERAIASGRYIALLDELCARVDDMEAGRCETLSSLLFRRFGKVAESTSSAMFSLSADHATEGAIRRLMRKAGKDAADAVLVQAIEAADADNLSGMAALVNSQELAHGRLAADGAATDRQLVSSGGLDAVEEAFVQKWRALAAEPGELLKRGTRLHMTLYLASCLDEVEYRAFWEGALAMDSAFHAYLPICFAQQWSSSNGEFGWTFDTEGIGRVMDEGALVQNLEGLFSSGALKDRFSEVDRCKVAAYCAGPDASMRGDDMLSFKAAREELRRREG